MDSTSCYIDRVITITGPIESCSDAEEMISEKMRQCFEQDSGSFQVTISTDLLEMKIKRKEIS